MAVAVVAVAIIIGAFLARPARPQDKPPTAFTPTEVQALRLQVKQKDAQLAQQAMSAAQANFSKALLDLNAEAERVKSEQHWNKDVTFNPNDLSFSAPAPAPVPAVAKPAEKKP